MVRCSAVPGVASYTFPKRWPPLMARRGVSSGVEAVRAARRETGGTVAHAAQEGRVDRLRGGEGR